MLVARVTGFGKANPAESGLPRVGGLPAPGPGPGPAGLAVQPMVILIRYRGVPQNLEAPYNTIYTRIRI